MNAIETRKLTKMFNGHVAVDELNLVVPQGSIFGFLGPNGAGKTTTLRMLVGLARPTSGEAWVLGEPISRPSRRYLGRIGYLPDVPGFYNWMRPYDFLKLVGEIFGLKGRDLTIRIGEALELTGLAGVKTKIGGFSRGMKQRLGLAQALLNRPELIFLDEPTSALDPIGRKEVLDTMGRLAGQTTVFFSTHILNDVERVCDTVAILHQGKLLAQQRIHELRESYASRSIQVEVEGNSDLTSLLKGQDWVEQVERYGEGWRLRPRNIRVAQYRLPEFLSAHGLALRKFEILEPSLEDIFVRLVKEK
ncbi:MAG: ABC transporter ATP-binding protein [Clostridia bacterium]|nr:ABC transporter ATP-binding protein [Clostridia bacterium]